MPPSNPVRLVDENGRAVSSTNPLPVSGSVGGGGGDVNVTNSELDVNVTNAGLDVSVTGIDRPTVVRHGQTTVSTAGSEQVLGGDLALKSGVTVKALPGNTGVIYVGSSTVTSSNGLVLEAGDQVFIDVSNVNLVYVDSAEDGDGVSWIGS